MNIPEADKIHAQNFVNALQIHVEKTKRRKTIPHRVRVKATGQFIVTRSNKTVWPSIGAAKNALRLDYADMFKYSFTNSYEHRVSGEKVPYQERKRREDEAFKYACSELLEFVPCPHGT